MGSTQHATCRPCCNTADDPNELRAEENQPQIQKQKDSLEVYMNRNRGPKVQSNICDKIKSEPEEIQVNKSIGREEIKRQEE